MANFEDYFTAKTITAFLCRLRAKQANKRNKKNILYRLSKASEYNYHKTEAENYTDYEKIFYSQLNQLLPKRRQWIEPNAKGRINKKTKEKYSTADKNASAIAQTISFYGKKFPEEEFLKSLDAFIKDIQQTIFNPKIKIDTPSIYPKYKDTVPKGKINKPRPISLFNLKDRIILSLTNRYLTDLLDEYFQPSSFAFRAKNKITNILPTHHDCIKEIKEFRKRNGEGELYAVECDMEKFFDSVDHKLIKELFFNLITKVKEINSEEDYTAPVRIFNAYLDSYAFNVDALPLNKDIGYWEKYLEKFKNKDLQRSYSWVEKELENEKYYEDIGKERIGIPQGGALSGLIANIVLNVADLEMQKSNAFYARFCDDMIIFHPDEEECNKAKEIYIESLRKLKLVPHHFCKNEDLLIERKKQKRNLPLTTIQPFWDNKSKGPYKWTSIENGGFPWIGFVGYEMHYQGHIRVRKSSMKKELSKQKKVVSKIREAILKERRKKLGTAPESAIHTLVGMSVGRVELKNFDILKHELCWNNGFKELTENKHSVQQIKQLDRNRNRLYYKLADELDEQRKTEPSDDGNTSPKRQLIDFNKPFSYYYQVLERKAKEETK
jgi:hypothetical protein